MEDRYQLLVKFLQRHLGDIPISESFSLENDLGVTGDDGIDLIKAYAKEFNVDISGLTYSKYFYREPDFFSAPHEIDYLIRVKDLLKGIITGELNLP